MEGDHPLKAEAHLAAVCPGMAALIPLGPDIRLAPAPEREPYESLVRSVVFQQLSGKAATTILNRVIALFPGQDFPQPDQLLAADPESLRAAGLSRQKIAAVRDIAEKRLSGIIPPLGELDALGDDEIIARLTQARGVGRWTVEMYLIFTLARPDVLPVDDLGVRRGAEVTLQRSFTPKELAAYGQIWAPWRSLASLHLWAAADRAKPGGRPD